MKKPLVKGTISERPVDCQDAKVATFPDLKPTSTAISPRLPNRVLAQLKVQAHRKDMPIQSFIEGSLADAVGPK